MAETEPINGNGHSNGEATTLAELHTVYAEIRALEQSLLTARTTWARNHGLSFGGARDLYKVLGYEDSITIAQYRSMYERGGVAGSIVDVMPEATWRGDPAVDIVENEDPNTDTEFEKAWKTIERKHQICAKFLRVDKLSRLSTYSILLIGAPGDLDTELDKGAPEKLLYLMPFIGGGGPGASSSNLSLGAATGSDASVYEYDTNPSSERFGLPQTYWLKRVDIASPAFQRPVHWSRVIHVAEGVLDDEVFGRPALERVWNLLTDLQKVTGGGAEAFWLRANAGLHLDVSEKMSLADAAGSIAALKEQAEDYKHQITRWLRTRGVDVKTLGSDVANFGDPSDAIITQIAGSTGIPKRILTGSEMGELASSQDRENFRDKVIGRQLQYAGPYIVRQLIDRFIKYGYLPQPASGEYEYEVKWPHIQVMTEQERVAGANGWASVNNAYGSVVFTDAEIRDKWAGYEPLTDQQKKEIADANAEKIKQQQEAMGGAPPSAAAQDGADDEGTDELVKTLADAIDVGNVDVVRALTLRTAGGAGSGNFGHEGRPGQRGGSSSEGGAAANEPANTPPLPAASPSGNSSGRTDAELQEHAKSLPHGTPVLKSKYGTVEVLIQGRGGPSPLVRFGARRKNGELVATKGTLREAKQALREPREENRHTFPSGYLSPDVKWKELV